MEIFAIAVSRNLSLAAHCLLLRTIGLFKSFTITIELRRWETVRSRQLNPQCENNYIQCVLSSPKVIRTHSAWFISNLQSACRDRFCADDHRGRSKYHRWDTQSPINRSCEILGGLLGVDRFGANRIRGSNDVASTHASTREQHRVDGPQ